MKWEFSVGKFSKFANTAGKLSSFPQFPEITPLFASRNFFKFNRDVWSNKKLRPGVQLHEGGKICLTLDRKLVARWPHGPGGGGNSHIWAI